MHLTRPNTPAGQISAETNAITASVGTTARSEIIQQLGVFVDLVIFLPVVVLLLWGRLHVAIGDKDVFHCLLKPPESMKYCQLPVGRQESHHTQTIEAKKPSDSSAVVQKMLGFFYHTDVSFLPSGSFPFCTIMFFRAMIGDVFVDYDTRYARSTIYLQKTNKHPASSAR